MIFELMSRGTLAELPEDQNLAVEEYGRGDVVLLLPYRGYLHGRIRNGYESWMFCRPGISGGAEREEIFLYDGEPRRLDFDGGHRVVIPGGAVDKLKSALLTSSKPPGDHFQAAVSLKGFLETEIAGSDLFIYDEDFALAQLDGKIEAKAAYWAVRFALSRGEHDAVARIKVWYRVAPGIAFSEPGVSVWFSLTQTPDAEAVAAMTALGITEENINRIAIQTVSPVVLFSKGGYLVFASYGDGQSAPLFREWEYFPAAVWYDLRERRRVTLRELLTAAWGANDARAALKTISKYIP